jgi:PAS domain S-box-containing protein
VFSCGRAPANATGAGGRATGAKLQNLLIAIYNNSQRGEAAMNPAKILVVEDDLIVADHIRKMLIRCGYAVPVITGYGEEAVRLAAGVRPDLVLMDIGLLGPMDGIEVAERIRHLDVPVVFLAARLDAEAAQRAVAAEPFGFVGKPFGEQELRAVVEIALCKRRIERELKERDPRLSAALCDADHALIATDPAGRVLFANARAERLMGWSLSEARNRAVGEVLRLVSEKGGRTRADPFKPVLHKAVPLQVSRYFLRSKHGASVPVECGSAPLRDGAGRVFGAVIVLIADPDEA